MPGQTILCIDDEELGLEIRRIVLERAGYRVLTASDGERGLALFGQHRVDAVILDYAMPGMNGGEVASAMRRERPRIPILLLSAYLSLPEEATRAANASLTKGEGADALLAHVEKLLAADEALPGEAGSR